MKRFRFHLGTLVILILILGVGFAALRQSNETWDSSIFSITLGVLLVSILLAVHRTQIKRAFWVGFALFGPAYLGLAQIPSIESRLVTTRALAYLDSKLARSAPAGIAYFDYDNDGLTDILVTNNAQSNVVFRSNGNGTFQDVTVTAGSNAGANQAVGGGWISEVAVGPTTLAGLFGTTIYFVRIGHCLLAMVAALLGGQLSRYFYVRSRHRDRGSVSAPVPSANDSGV